MVVPSGTEDRNGSSSPVSPWVSVGRDVRKGTETRDGTGRVLRR